MILIKLFLSCMRIIVKMPEFVFFSSQNEFRELEDDDGPSPGQPSPPQFTPGWVRDYGKSTGG